MLDWLIEYSLLYNCQLGNYFLILRFIKIWINFLICWSSKFWRQQKRHLNISRWLTPIGCLFSTPHLTSTPEPVLALCSLGVAPFFSDFLSKLLDTIALPAKHTPPHYLLHNQPNFNQQLASRANREHFYFLSADPYYHDDTRFEHG